jgi:hypothetical protein
MVVKLGLAVAALVQGNRRAGGCQTRQAMAVKMNPWKNRKTLPVTEPNRLER